jgi:hypothetical protein
MKPETAARLPFKPADPANPSYQRPRPASWAPTRAERWAEMVQAVRVVEHEQRQAVERELRRGVGAR